jgi:hypothetical protein
MDTEVEVADKRAWEDRRPWQNQPLRARQPQHWRAGASSWRPYESRFTPPLGVSNHLRFRLATPEGDFSRYSTQVLHFGNDIASSPAVTIDRRLHSINGMYEIIART